MLCGMTLSHIAYVVSADEGLLMMNASDVEIGRAVVGPNGFDGFQGYLTPPNSEPIDLGFFEDDDDCMMAIEQAESDRLAGGAGEPS